MPHSKHEAPDPAKEALVFLLRTWDDVKALDPTNPVRAGHLHDAFEAARLALGRDYSATAKA